MDFNGFQRVKTTLGSPWRHPVVLLGGFGHLGTPWGCPWGSCRDPWGAPGCPWRPSGGPLGPRGGVPGGPVGTLGDLPGVPGDPPGDPWDRWGCPWGVPEGSCRSKPWKNHGFLKVLVSRSRRPEAVSPRFYRPSFYVYGYRRD